MRKLYMAAWTFIVLSTGLAFARTPPSGTPSHDPGQVTPRSPAAGAEAVRWFSAIRPHCNAVEIDTQYRWNPPPSGWRGAGFGAACLALAGRVDRAREVIAGLPADERWRAAGIVFDVGHPVADSGDDRSAGPMMELVVEFWPDHYMALYHAGMARLGLGETDGARDYLERFLEHYAAEDGWTRAARVALERLGA